MKQRSGRWVTVLTCLVIGVTLAACAPVSGSRSGGAGGLTQLVMAQWYADHDPPPALHVFVNRVFELSGGSLPIMLEAIPTGTVTEPKLLRHVASGGADLGFVGTRALDQVGIRAFQPLSLPYLVDSYRAEAAVVSDPEVVKHLSELDQVGVSGLALLADELSLPVGVQQDVRSLRDFSGTTFRTDESEVQLGALRALGAVPTTAHLLIEGDPPYQAYDTTLRSFVGRYHDDLHRRLTINAPLWPQSTVLFVNPDSLGRLSTQQREWVRTAASDAAQWSIQHAGDDVAAELSEVCSRGGLITTATAAQRAALRAKVRPVYRQMRADPEVSPVLARVEALVQAAGSHSEDTRAGCGPGPGTAPPPPAPTLAGPGRVGALPEGIYRVPVSAAEGTSSAEAGVLTWTLRAGQWSFVRQAGYVPSTCYGYYDVVDDHVTFETTKAEPFGTCAPPGWTARWTAADSSVRWSDVSVAGYAAEFAGPGWTRIG